MLPPLILLVSGVVDSALRVYGTANVRVADASIIPLHIGHTQATMYAIAEKVRAHFLPVLRICWTNDRFRLRRSSWLASDLPDSAHNRYTLYFLYNCLQ